MGQYTEQDIQNVYQQALNDREDGVIEHTSSFEKADDENLVKWQLELDNILERIDHLLRGQQISFKNGNLIWIPSTRKEDETFNDFGVNEVLRILTVYLNRNTILSNYDEETINLKVYDFGNEVSDLILNKYEEMGLDTNSKMVVYPLVVRWLIDIVHSAYLRALNGGERESLREARTVNQNLSPMGMPMGMMGMQRSERGMFNPMRYVLGKYK